MLTEPAACLLDRLSKDIIMIQRGNVNRAFPDLNQMFHVTGKEIIMFNRARIPYEKYYTTDRFGRQGKQYHRHCGPTAAVNVFATILAVRDARTESDRADELFRDFIDSAQKWLIYINADLFGYFGGTLDIRAGEFLRRCARICGMNSISVSRRRRMNQREMLAALKRGSILYLELTGRTRYGRHHMVCYGARVPAVKGPPLFRIADGWSAKPVYMRYEDLGRGFFIEVSCPRP